jgi:hypothetical protein
LIQGHFSIDLYVGDEKHVCELHHEQYGQYPRDKVARLWHTYGNEQFKYNSGTIQEVDLTGKAERNSLKEKVATVASMFTRLGQGKGKQEQGHTARRKPVSGTGDPSRTWNLKGWGWEGYVAYMNHAHSLSIYKHKTGKQCASAQYCQLLGPASMISTELNKS